MDEIKELEERVERLEHEQKALQKQVLKLSKILGDGQAKRRQKPRIIVGPSEGLLPPEILPSKPRPGDIQCSDE